MGPIEDSLESHPAGKLRDVPNLLGLHERCRKNPLEGLRKQGIESAHDA
jgi:hypothetical protein